MKQYKLTTYIAACFSLLFISININSQHMKISEIIPKGNTKIKLYILNGGEIKVPDMSIFGTGEKKGVEYTFSNTIYLIKHPKGNILWDTGLPDSISNKKEGMQMMGGALKFIKSDKLISQLKEINIKPSDIDYISFTNLHPVFVGNISYFENATVLIQEKEYKTAHQEDAPKYGYNPESYSMLSEMKIKKLNGHYDVFGDGSFVILSMPATSAGHQTFYIDLPKSGPKITAGDLFAYKQRRENYSVPPFITNKKQMVKSFASTDILLKQTGAELWLNHDIEIFKSLKHLPEYYD